MELKLWAIGNSVSVVLPKEVLGRLRADEGDVPQVIETKDGVLLTSIDPNVTEQLRVGRDVMRRCRNTLRALAK